MKFLIILFLVSCAGLNKIYQTIPLYYTYMKEIKEVFKVFEDHCGFYPEIKVSFNYLPGRAVGSCYGFGMSRFLRSIELDWDYWNSSSYYEREMTLLHELGHCISDLEHDLDWGWLPQGPDSLMYPYTFSSFFYLNDRTAYIRSVCPLLTNSSKF